MPRLVGSHGGNQLARAQIRGVQRLEMAGEVLFDLALGFGEEGEIPAIAQDPGGHPQSKRPHIPQRIKQARAPAELADALRAPGEVIALLSGGALERLARPVPPRRQCLALVQRLRADLERAAGEERDRKSTRLNSSHQIISYA